MPLEWLFGRKKTPQEMLRQNQRALNKAMRDLDRERQHMEQQEKKIIADIKKMAKQGQMVNYLIYCPNLIFCTRYYILLYYITCLLFQLVNINYIVSGCCQNYG